MSFLILDHHNCIIAVLVLVPYVVRTLYFVGPVQFVIIKGIIRLEPPVHDIICVIGILSRSFFAFLFALFFAFGIVTHYDRYDRSYYYSNHNRQSSNRVERRRYSGFFAEFGSGRVRIVPDGILCSSYDRCDQKYACRYYYESSAGHLVPEQDKQLRKGH